MLTISDAIDFIDESIPLFNDLFGPLFFASEAPMQTGGGLIIGPPIAIGY